MAVVLAACGTAPPAFPEAADDTSLTEPDATTRVATQDDGTTAFDDASSTGADLESDGSTAGASSTGSEPAICGDGIPQRDEPCDDANRSQIDGCTSSCELGPIAVRRIGRPVASPILLYDDQPPEVSVDADCPDGEAVVGIDMGWPKGLAGITVRCATVGLLDADPTAIDTGRGTILAPIGLAPGNDYAIGCPSGEVLGELTAAGNNNGYMYGLGGTCRTLDVTGKGGRQVLTIGAGTVLEYQGFQEEEDLTACPRHTVATGVTVQMRSGNWPVAVGLRCHTLELGYS